MKQNACCWCQWSIDQAWDAVTKFFKSPPPFIDSQQLNRYRSFILLSYRAGVEGVHGTPGFLLQQLMSPRWRRALPEVVALHRRSSFEYPDHVWKIVRAIEDKTKVFTVVGREDFKRYAPYLDAEFITELFGEDE